MDNEGYQKELFEFEDRPRKSFPGLKILPKADFEGKISVTLGLEKVVFISIGVILLSVIVFALGVERGRTLAMDEIGEAKVKVFSAPKEPETQPLPQKASEPAVTKSAGIVITPKSGAALQANADPGEVSSRPYTIIALTFKDRDTAAQAVSWLKKEGLPAYQKQDGQYFPVCVGTYANRAAAQSALLKVKRLCKEAYIKVRQ